MIKETLTLLAETMDEAIGPSVALADLARQSSPANRVLLTLLGQELHNRNQDLPPRGARAQPQQVSITVVAACYFEEYREALAAQDAVWAFVSDSPLLPQPSSEERISVRLLSPPIADLAAYWSALRMPLVPSVFLQVLTFRAPSTVGGGELPVLQRPVTL